MALRSASTNLILKSINLKTHHVYSTLKRRGNYSFHVVSTWNICGVFAVKHIQKIFINTANQECYEDSLSIRKEIYEKDLHWENLNVQ